MKRTKAASANEKLGNCSSYADLPSDIITKIMLTLPIESILICKCVCNNWKAVISDSHFAKLHLQHSHVRYMFRITAYNNLPVPLVSRALYLLPQFSEIECNNHLKLKPSFKLPLRNGKSILGNRKYESKRSIRATAAAAKSPYIACNPNYMKFEIVNSCNGLLCLASPSREGFKLPIVICNPITGEFITLPKPLYNTGHKNVRFGLGFQPKTNEYKVMKLWSTNANKLFEESSLFIETYTLGTPTWRNVEVDPEFGKLVLRLDYNWKFDFLTCLTGALHWIGFSFITQTKMLILCFNFESERLQSFPSPPHDEFQNDKFRGMGELRGFLYLCCYDSRIDATIMWIMKKYGDGESWTKAYSIDARSKPCGMPITYYSLCLPLKHPEEAAPAALLLCRYGDCFTYYVSERCGFKAFVLVGYQSDGGKIEGIPHIPSLFSLKDIVKGDNIEVLNIHSLCAKVKLEEENKVISVRTI